MGNTFKVGGIEYEIVRNPYTNGPMIARVDGIPIENRKEICRRFLRLQGWNNEMFGNRITNDLERQINKILNGKYIEKTSNFSSNERKEVDPNRIHPEMTQKDEILYLLKENGMMTSANLSTKMYGDSNHTSNINESLQSLVRKGFVTRSVERPSYYSLSSNEASITTQHKVKAALISYPSIRREDVPTPSEEQVEYYLKSFDELENYAAQEKAIDRLFYGDFNSNKDFINILIKCSVLNDFYSTNIPNIYPVAKHIFALNIDERLKSGDISLVDDIAKNNIKGKDWNYYSFASKYCSHHNEFEFPIYDSFVAKVLKYFRKVDRFSNFSADDLRIYPEFKNILLEFRKFYKLEKYNLKELDKFLWQFGKRYFPKNSNEKEK